MFAYSPIAFDILKHCGAVYLVYLGVSGLVRGGIAGVVTNIDPRARPLPLKNYRQGVLTDLLNPKLLLFFFSFLPQFVHPDSGEPWMQMLVLGLLFQVTGIPANLAVGSPAGSIARWFAVLFGRAFRTGVRAPC